MKFVTAIFVAYFVVEMLMSFVLKQGDIKLPARVQDAMQMQVEAERKKRAAILESEGIREAEINVAEGKKRAKILSSGKFIPFSYFCTFYINYSILQRLISRSK
jgi:hypothetical protein